MRLQSIFFLFAIIGIMFEQCLGSNDTEFSGYNTIDTGSPLTFSCNDTARERIVLRDPCGTIISPCYFDENYNLNVGFGVKIYDLNANNGTEIVAYQLIIREFETSYYSTSLYFYPSQFASFQNGLFQTDDSFHQYVLSGSASSDGGIYIGRGNSKINVNGSLLLSRPSYIMQFVSRGFRERGFRLTYCADFNLCKPDVICSSPEGGKCRRNGFRSYSCVCNTGYTGPACVADQTKVTLESTMSSTSATNPTLSTSTTPSVSKSSTSGISSPTYTTFTGNDSSNIPDRNDTDSLGSGENDVSFDENHIAIIAGAGGAALFLLTVLLFICRKKSKKSEKITYKSFDAAGKNNSIYDNTDDTSEA